MSMEIQSGNKSSSRQDLTLQALLANIESETAPFLAETLRELQERAKHEARQEVLHVTFCIGDIENALPINSIQEIGYMPSMTHLPHLPLWIPGITHIRGEIISIVDIKLLFQIPDTSQVDPAYYILLAGGAMKFGMPVDRVTGVFGLDELRDTLSPHPRASESGQEELAFYIKGRIDVSGRDVNVLDGDKLLQSSLVHEYQ